MAKPVYRVTYDHILLTGQNEYNIDLDNNVIGVALRVFSTSPEGLTYGLNIGATIPLSSADLPATYGGYHVNEVPALIADKDGKLNIKWNNGSTAGQGVAIIARLLLEPVQDLEVCE